MASGVAVDNQCIETFKSLVKDRKYRCTVFKINDDMTEVQVENTYPPVDGSPKDGWDQFKKTLPETDCRYVAYDFTYEHQGANKQRVLFVLWSPEGSKIKSKMIYAASQEGVVNKLEGIQRQLQCNDPDEIEYDVIVKQLAAHTASY